MSEGNLKVLLAPGSRNRHVPALSVALELRKRFHSVDLTWVGSGRGREKHLCRKYHITLFQVNLDGRRKLSSFFGIIREFFRFNSFFRKERPSAVLSFGGYESMPLLAAARLRSIPYFLLEPNAVPDPVNRFFAGGAKKIFFGLTPVKSRVSGNSPEITGVPVLPLAKKYEHYQYPRKLDRAKKTILIIGSEEADNLGSFLINMVKIWADNGIQIVWKTGKGEYGLIRNRLRSCRNVLLFPTLKDPYPFYAVSRLVIGRSTPLLLSEAAFFGLPCVLIPSIESHIQWVNAGLVQNQGWAFRFTQENSSENMIIKSVQSIINDQSVFESMSRKALDYSPFSASSIITGKIVEELGYK